MTMGLLRVKGTIDLGQFWPKGSADADTTKILVTVGRDAFQFRERPGSRFRVTHAFDKAVVVGRIRKPAMDKNQVTVRLQGIDAPELHYRPSSRLTDKAGRTKAQKDRYLEVNEDYRQYLAETATVKLARFLGRAAKDPLPCVFETAVDTPGEAFDCYGRLVGDILVRIGRANYNVSQWLAQQGWAYPAFYNSMSADEIQTLRSAADRARAKDRPVWRQLNGYARATDFDRDLRYRRPKTKPSFAASKDQGPVVLPKLFRRLSTWAVNQYAGMVTSGFWSYLESCREECYLTNDFLNQPTVARTRYLHEFLHLDGLFESRPDELTFKEATSELVRPGGGQPHW